MKWQFLPNLLFIVLAVFYMHETLSVEEIHSVYEDRHSAKYVFLKVKGVTTILLLGYAVYTEYWQIKARRRKYFKSFWNWVDLVNLSLTFLITIVTLLEVDWVSIESLRILAAFASCLLFVNIYDWLRLFESTAFYVTLVQETLQEARWFMLLVLVALVVFGMPMSMLALNRTDNPKKSLVGNYTDW
eukprot:CAMPEP_0185586908 /NCGR_PEP_ID=MMETSP0434-20130131/46624_1 /TAXON_ID=626734 ORGANISM="Favella taraikaensis, Strain Fe Narragansett Bay" /NCGR_SAMPLE_ID=MMETSP0434 /ASSEMBLY_ACC=CAM_ASM_000379 /LENGTH=186 /DNA_ID=CAMNT_0028208379 /DNA_START=145 /DNA_END=702 /DNA_ORIENTATION=+